MWRIYGPTFDEQTGKWISTYTWCDGIGQHHEELYDFDSEEEAEDFDQSKDVNKW